MVTVCSVLRCLPAALLAFAAASEAQNVGQWGPMVKFPVVPVAVALLPETGNMLVWSSGWPNRWTTAGNGKTYTSIYDVKTGKVSNIHDHLHPAFSLVGQTSGYISLKKVLVY
ncbi:galactose oxidase [Colletotrichum liriopes]|uniref:Galactose oxidase n=1 Tax=Colletotrichum liriopes TaxID=708192 RepID=A0AA37GUA5_9PEZI|nr:galactose oxidase [Colletotrichum liriopes]